MRALRRSAALIAVLVVIVAWQHPEPPAPVLQPDAVPNVPELASRAAERVLLLPGSNRPPVLASPALRSADKVSPPALMNGPEVMTKRAQWGEDTLGYVVPRSALPFRYKVEAALADRFGLDTITGAMAAWDGIPGSAWATEFAGIERGAMRRARADGVSTVFLRTVCPTGWLGYAHWNVEPRGGDGGSAGGSVLDARYGAMALYVSEVDIAICPAVSSAEQAAATIVHEVGHAMGMGHLCLDGCEAVGAEEHEEADDAPALPTAAGCRPMRPQVRSCPVLAGADRDAARHLHPTLARLAGPSAPETAARASYALTADHAAPLVVVAPLSAPPQVQLVAASLSTRTRAPFLLATPDAERCLDAAAAEELARAAGSQAQVALVGTWPERCEEVLTGWDLRVERFDAAHFSALAVSVAERLAATGPAPSTAFLVSTATQESLSAGLPLVASGAGPLLLAGAETVAPMVLSWLAEHPGIRQVVGVGLSDGMRARLRALGIEVFTVDGLDPPAEALATTRAPLADVLRRGDALPPDAPVVLSRAGGWRDGLVAATVSARIGGRMLYTSAEPDPAVERWLRAQRPAGGYVIGGLGAVPAATGWRYGVWVQPGPVPTALNPGGELPPIARRRAAPPLASG